MTDEKSDAVERGPTKRLANVYSVLLKVLFPTIAEPPFSCSLCGGGEDEEGLSRTFFWVGIAILLVCGNGWLAGAMTRHLDGKICRSIPSQPPIASWC